MRGAYSSRSTPLAAVEPAARTVAWYYRESQGGEIRGPSVIETLCTLWRCGELTEDSLVKPEGAARFVRVRDAPALLAMLHSQTASSQPPSPQLCATDFGASRAGRAPSHASDWDELHAERAELARARAQLEADVAAFDSWRSDTLALIAAKRALLSSQ